MSKTIKIQCGVAECLERVHDLRNTGAVQGTDFDFAYNQTEWDPVSGHMIQENHANFIFYNEMYATMFALKYGC